MIVSTVNRYIHRFIQAALPIYVSRDWHPANHISFITHGGQWPTHCVAGTFGAEFHPDLHLPSTAEIISKATSADREAYSALDHTPLKQKLLKQGIQRVFLCGLATDFCVLESGRDLLREGFHVVILADAIQAVDLQPGDGERARQELVSQGAVEIEEGDIAL
jgi:nicotinamidase/pyrazinamidase